MKVLWFVQENFDPSREKGGYNGAGWISSLRNEIIKNEGIDLAMAFFSKETRVGKASGVKYYSMETPKLSPYKKMCFRIKGQFNQEEEALWSEYRNKMLKVLDDFKPDIIQIFGSENKYGLIASVTKVPVILHIQGVLGPYFNAFLPPYVSKRDFYFKDGLNPIKIIKNLSQIYNWKMMTHCESNILKNINYYFGRTTWDYRIAKLYNQDATYFFGNEVLRESFYEEEMKRQLPSKLKVVSTISSPPYKGYDLILKTAKLLCSMNLEFEWIVFGNISPSFIEGVIGIKHEDVHVNLFGVASEKQIKEMLLSSTVYVHPSYIDNSPNSVCEAQMCGIPVIATYVGGVCSIVEEGVTGYLVPANDSHQLAYLIQLLYNDLELNLKIGTSAFAAARKRHDKSLISDKIFFAYNEINRKCQLEKKYIK